MDNRLSNGPVVRAEIALHGNNEYKYGVNSGFLSGERSDGEQACHKKIREYYRQSHRIKIISAGCIQGLRKKGIKLMSLWKYMRNIELMKICFDESKKRIIFGFLLASWISGASAGVAIIPPALVAGSAIHIPFDVSGSYRASSGTLNQLSCSGGAYIAIGSSPMNGYMGNYCLTSSQMAWSANGLYYGYKVEDGVILSIVNGHSSAFTKLGNPDLGVSTTPYSSSIEWDGNGVSTGTWIYPSGTQWNTGMPWASGGRYLISAGDVFEFSASGEVVISIDPSVPSGKNITIPNIWLAGVLRGTEISNTSIITIKRPISECTVSAPPLVDFGEVQGSGQGWTAIAHAETQVAINCIGEGNARIAFQAGPLFYTRSEVLELTTNGSYGVGLLYGMYGSGNVSSCSGKNSNDASAIKFDGTVSKTLTLYDGLNNVPITWTVCRRGDLTRFGATSAQATMNLDWD